MIVNRNFTNRFCSDVLEQKFRNGINKNENVLKIWLIMVNYEWWWSYSCIVNPMIRVQVWIFSGFGFRSPWPRPWWTEFEIRWAKPLRDPGPIGVTFNFSNDQCGMMRFFDFPVCIFPNISKLSQKKNTVPQNDGSKPHPKELGPCHSLKCPAELRQRPWRVLGSCGRIPGGSTTVAPSEIVIFVKMESNGTSPCFIDVNNIYK